AMLDRGIPHILVVSRGRILTGAREQGQGPPPPLPRLLILPLLLVLAPSLLQGYHKKAHPHPFSWSACHVNAHSAGSHELFARSAPGPGSFDRASSRRRQGQE